MHVHSPSEHTFNGKNYDLELHLVHKLYDSDTLGVVSISFDSSKDVYNAFVASWHFSHVGDSQSTLIPLQQLINKVDKTKLYHYKGSLTTPPCSEGVQWMVLPKPLAISK